jgi:hypothetical protein
MVYVVRRERHRNKKGAARAPFFFCLRCSLLRSYQQLRMSEREHQKKFKSEKSERERDPEATNLPVASSGERATGASAA